GARLWGLGAGGSEFGIRNTGFGMGVSEGRDSGFGVRVSPPEPRVPSPESRVSDPESLTPNPATKWLYLIPNGLFAMRKSSLLPHPNLGVALSRMACAMVTHAGTSYSR